MSNKPPTLPAVSNPNLRIIDAVAFQLYAAAPVPQGTVVDFQSEWRGALPSTRSQYRNEATELIGRLADHGIEIRTTGKKGEEMLGEFITDLMTHPARAAYDEYEIRTCLNN